MAGMEIRRKHMVFQCSWMSGYRTSVKAEDAGLIMKKLESEGRLTPQDLVEEARPIDSPIHKGFEWDDAKAAENYRRHQASIMIRAIVVRESEVIENGREDVSVKIFNLPEKGGSYESLRTILLDEDKAENLLARAKEELGYFRKKYSQIQRLSKVISAINEVLSEGA